MTERANRIARNLAAAVEDLRELEREEPDEVAAIVASLVAHVRAWRPESIAPLGTLPEPTGPVRDPRGSHRRGA